MIGLINLPVLFSPFPLQPSKLSGQCSMPSASSTGRTCLSTRSVPRNRFSTSGRGVFMLSAISHPVPTFAIFRPVFNFILLFQPIIPLPSLVPRLTETPQSGKFSDLDGNPLHTSRSMGLARSQEPIYSEDLSVALFLFSFRAWARNWDPEEPKWFLFSF